MSPTLRNWLLGLLAALAAAAVGYLSGGGPSGTPPTAVQSTPAKPAK